MKKKTAEYLMRAEQIASQHLRSNMGQGSTQTVVSGRGVSAAPCAACEIMQMLCMQPARVFKALEAARGCFRVYYGGKLHSLAMLENVNPFYIIGFVV